MNYQTPLARARGLGSSRTGSHHWWRQRITAIALIPLSIWLGLAIARLPDIGYEELVAWITAPWNTVLLLSFISLGFFHAMLGVQTVVEDYVHCDWLKIVTLVGLKLVLAFLAMAGVLATLRIAFAG